MRTSKRSALARAVLAGAVLGMASSAHAATLTWDNDGIGTPAGGSGVWNTSSANWWNGTTYTLWSNATPDNAVFPSSAGTVTLGTSIVAGSIAFNANGYRIDLNGNGLMT